jgi:hypothetical protein
MGDPRNGPQSVNAEELTPHVAAVVRSDARPPQYAGYSRGTSLGGRRSPHAATPSRFTLHRPRTTRARTTPERHSS